MGKAAFPLSLVNGTYKGTTYFDGDTSEKLPWGATIRCTDTAIAVTGLGSDEPLHGSDDPVTGVARISDVDYEAELNETLTFFQEGSQVKVRIEAHMTSPFGSLSASSEATKTS